MHHWNTQKKKYAQGLMKHKMWYYSKIFLFKTSSFCIVDINENWFYAWKWVADTWLLCLDGFFCLQSWPQNKNPSLSRNCLFIRFLPHPLQLKQCGQACQLNSPCDKPGESAVIVFPHVWQIWKLKLKSIMNFVLQIGITKTIYQNYDLLVLI